MKLPFKRLTLPKFKTASSWCEANSKIMSFLLNLSMPLLVNE